MLEENRIGIHSLPNLGYLITKLPADLFALLKKEIRSIEANMEGSSFAGHKLTGNMEKEFDLVESKKDLENYILSLVQEYDYHFKYLDTVNCLNSNVPMCLQNLWVNFQKKHEFNPNHNHSGVFSFVIWVKIPYILEKERSESPGKYSNSNEASLFQFTYSDIVGNHRVLDLNIDKNFEGTICLFPNKLVHCVYPFYTSDDYRISVSGNISLKVK